MVICFPCESHTKSVLDQLVASGNYADYGEVISAAVANLSVIETAARPSGGVVLHDASRVIRKAERRQLEPSKNRLAKRAPEIPPLFVLPAHHAPSETAIVQANMGRGHRVTIDQWIFGQFGKLLPAKVNRRGLANLLAQHPGGIALDKASFLIAKEASDLGQYLASIDVRSNASRDDALAIGFPAGDRERADKSRLRYAAQYVGNRDGAGKLSGLLGQLKLIDADNDGHVSLTAAAWAFAQLENPAIDRGGWARFSDEEIEFLLKHICSQVWNEEFALRAVLTCIMEGQNTPSQLDAVCATYIPDDRDMEFSEAQLTTQRTGVVSRANDLGLLVRVRDGVHVTYAITERGTRFLQQPVEY